MVLILSPETLKPQTAIESKNIQQPKHPPGIVLNLYNLSERLITMITGFTAQTAITGGAFLQIYGCVQLSSQKNFGIKQFREGN
jgi:hypothetical protein